MTQLTIKTSVQKEVEKNIILPAFWKEPNYRDYVAVIDEKTCIKLFTSTNGEYTSISHGPVDSFRREIAEADEKWDPITEQEFLSTYDDAHESVRMQPMLIDTGREQAYQDFAKTQNF